MGQKFSRAFNATFRDEKSRNNYLYTTAYGPAISRILVSIISTHGDNKGLVLPFCISPIEVVIIPIYDAKNKAKVLKYCNEIKSKLHKSNIKAKMDEREDYSPGWKFHEWELKGVPFRLEVGEKEVRSKKLTLFNRDTGKKQKISINSLSKLKDLGKKYDEELRKKADKSIVGKITNCKNKEEIKKALNSGKIARLNWCSIEKNGEKCAEHIEKDLGAEVRGILANKNEKPAKNSKCAICNRPANEIVYIGRSY